jgi:hypothetical protein
MSSVKHKLRSNPLTKSKYKYYFLTIFITVDRDSSVGVATRYCLEDQGIESRWGRIFPHPSRQVLESTQPPLKRAPVLFPEGKAVEQMLKASNLRTFMCQLSRNSGIICPACSGIALPFDFRVQSGPNMHIILVSNTTINTCDATRVFGTVFRGRNILPFKHDKTDCSKRADI